MPNKHYEELAKEYGCSLSTVRRIVKEAEKLPEDEIYDFVLKKLSEVRKKRSFLDGYSGKVQIYSNAILNSLVNTSGRNRFVDDYDCGVSKYQYKYTTKGRTYFERLEINIEGIDRNTYFKGITFRELLILSAVYSQMSIDRPEHDGKYTITLRSIYEFMNGSGSNWLRLDKDTKMNFGNEIVSLWRRLSKISGLYTCKKENEREFSVRITPSFSLEGNLYKNDGASLTAEEAQELMKTGFDNFCMHFKFPAMMSVCRSQGRIYTIPEDMLECKSTSRYNVHKIYIAYRVLLGNKENNSMRKTIRYDEIKRVCGDYDREFVKRYMKYLEDKGYAKGLKLDKDAVRWE